MTLSHEADRRDAVTTRTRELLDALNTVAYAHPVIGAMSAEERRELAEQLAENMLLP